ncbi:hypothetical protein PVAP13_4KG326910 [Panicum virgatum]|uniref:SAM domain-containing protein n=1 Tax=Panicum virgatum TaxID=38727 RepID=A0A8T0TVH1_PANVG|nr:hypothetical protein PVAP13_4KG326910 [Panicum virgatum]
MPPPAVQALAGCVRRRPWLATVRRYFCALEAAAVTHPGHWNRCFLVDMKALVSMNEEDMKSLGTPMGPRKKILSALAHKKRKPSKILPTS